MCRLSQHFLLLTQKLWTGYRYSGYCELEFFILQSTWEICAIHLNLFPHSSSHSLFFLLYKKTGLPQLVFFPGQHGQYTLHNWLFPDCYSSHHININKQNWHQKSHDTRCSTIAIGSVVEPDFFAGAGEKAPAPGCCCVV